jgi:hypothetical protein
LSFASVIPPCAQIVVIDVVIIVVITVLLLLILTLLVVILDISACVLIVLIAFDGPLNQWCDKDDESGERPEQEEDWTSTLWLKLLTPFTWVRNVQVARVGDIKLRELHP